MRKFHNISAIHFLLLISIIVLGVKAQKTYAAPPVVAPAKISASIDTTTITMGERTTLHVEVLKNGHSGNIIAPIQNDASQRKDFIGNIEIRKIDIDSTDLGNNRIQVNYEILIQPFDPNDIIIPAFKFALGKDTISSNPIALKVIEPEMPQEMRDSLFINPLRPPLSIKSEFFDWTPNWLSDYWYFILPGIILIGILVALLILYKKNGKSILPIKKAVPPYELAMRRLDELKRKRLHEQGHNKAYYTELTDILRQYLGRRFHIYALEMTSSQIMDELVSNPETKPFADSLRPMFQVADFVKFAKQESTPDENIRSFNAVEKFVKDTKPVEQPKK